MKIYTRKGDEGKTAVAGGKREFKDSVRIECIGTFDETNSTIGLLRVKLGNEHEWQIRLHKIQVDIMNLMSYLARPSKTGRPNPNPKPIDGAEFCENWIDEMENKIGEPSDYFILPGGNEISALCQVIRTQIRRAERRLVTLKHHDSDCVEAYISAYINRLSDLFFTMSRYEMGKHGVVEEKWNLFLYKKKKSR